MKAIVVTDPTAGTAGMTLTERPDPAPGGNDVLVEVHASGFTPGELSWPGTWVDHLGRDRTPSIPGHEVAGIVRSLGYGTRGSSARGAPPTARRLSASGPRSSSTSSTTSSPASERLTSSST